jgi:hypothetical protein
MKSILLKKTMKQISKGAEINSNEPQLQHTNKEKE